MSNQITIKIPLEVYQELVLRKVDTGVPISEQIRRLLKVKKCKPVKISK